MTGRNPCGELERLFPGDSELARRMRALDWSTTELGSPLAWPESLRTAVSICLTSRFPIVLWWGPNLTLLYNDAYVPLLGPRKHPQWLGRSGRECWSEIWPTIGPMLEGVMRDGRATWSEELLLFLNRHLPDEECYFTFSYSPILTGDASRVGGIFCAVTEMTDYVLGRRRLETLRELGQRTAQVDTASEACAGAMEVLAKNPTDVPFAGIYLVDTTTNEARLYGSVRGERADLPERVSLDGADEAWPIAAVWRSRRTAEVALRDGMEVASAGPAPARVSTALVLPVVAPGIETIGGVLVAGVNPRRVLDVAYRDFFQSIAAQIGAAVAESHAYEAERARAEKLAELDRAKTAFFSNVSHEFRTPLTLMLGPLEEALEAADTPPAQRRSLEVAHRNSLRLLRLVNTLLDFSRIEAGRLEAVFEQVDVAQATVDLASVFRSAVERAGLSLAVRCERPAAPVFVDRDMWEKIVLNLLSNAFKFTLRGGIDVTLEERGGVVELRVADTGAGIPGEELPHVFERFHRVRGTEGRTHEGTGIGLALVSELVKLHGGEVGVESGLGKGSTFTVRIPTGSAHLPAEALGAKRMRASTAVGAAPFIEEALRWLPDAAAPADAAASDHGTIVTTAGSRVLVVDDNADMRAYLVRLLSGYWAVTAAGDGAEAVAAVQQEPPDLVLSDVMMPRLDGMGLVRALRADPVLRSIPVILLSARAGEAARVEGLQSGADDYLTKPFAARELVARVNALLALSRVRRDAEAALRARSEELAAEKEALSRLHVVSERCALPRVDLRACLEEILGAAMWMTGARMGTVQVYDASSDSLKLVVHEGFGSRFVDHFASVRRGDAALCEAAFATAKRAIVEDVATSALFAGRPSRDVLLDAGVRAVQSTPLVTGAGTVVGMISTHFGEPHRPSERDCRCLDLLARQAADFLERCRSDEQREELLRVAQQARADAERANQAKDEFLATVSHELRSPLQGVLGWLTLLKRGSLDAAQTTRAIEAVERSVRLQAQLVHDIMDVSRIVSGRVVLERTTLELAVLLRQTADELMPGAVAKDIELRLDAEPCGLVVGDRERLHQVFSNLVANALKFTPPGGRITLSCERAGDQLVVTVADTGEGIAPEFLPRLFDRFTQADTSSTRRHGGLGLGLAIVRHLVELHHGTVSAESPGPGRGATFRVRLPVALPETATVAQWGPAPHAGMPRLDGVEILLVEDDRDALDAMTYALRATGAKVLPAASVGEAWVAFTGHEPDLVVSDLSMPDEDGYSLLRRIRDAPKNPAVPAIALTGFTRPEDKARVLHAGFAAYVPKPIDPEELVRVLVGVLDTHRVLH